VREGQAVTLYAACPVRVIHTDVELYRPVRILRSARAVPPWQPPADVDVVFLGRVLAGLRQL
jgi:hypothetical protein